MTSDSKGRALLFALDEFFEREEKKEDPLETTGGTTRAKQRQVKPNARWIQLSRLSEVPEVARRHSKGKSAGLECATGDQNKGKRGAPEVQSDSVAELEEKERYVADETTRTPALEVEARTELNSAAATHGSATTDSAFERKPTIPKGVVNQTRKLSGGSTVIARRRQKRAEGEVAAIQWVLAKKRKAQREERAKVLRVVVRRLIAELREVENLQQQGRKRREAQIAAAAVRKCEASARVREPAASNGSISRETAAAAEDPPPDEKQGLTEDEWLAEVARYEKEAPEKLLEQGSLAEIRVARRRALKAAKRFRWMKRVRRLQLLNERASSVVLRVGGTAKKNASHPRKILKQRYQYEQQGCYGDVKLRNNDAGQQIRVARLRAVGSGALSCLPTALLALTRRHTHEVGLDSCAQYSVAGEEMKKYGRCLTRKFPMDVVEGFGGGTNRVLGVWRFLGTTVYQQRLVVDALFIEDQGDELLIGEDWMAEKRVKLGFASRELKYYDEHGQKIILLFICHGLSTLQQPKQPKRSSRVSHVPGS